MLTFDEQVLKDALDQLPPGARVAFAASCAQRLTGIYHKFVAKTGQSEEAMFDAALNYVWANILGSHDAQATDRVLAETMTLLPHEDSPGWTPLTAYAEDAVAAAAYCLRCALSGDPQEAAWAARCVYEAIDYFLVSRDDIEPNSPDAQTRILGDPAMQAELARQHRDMAELEAAGESLSQSLLRVMRERSTLEQAIVLAD